ncbi:hypothetical protein CRE_22735 [Caenorhabditis remanei]|uniref:Uncharacterized protein n=1 Tax=Caenorhabditis remanei TaxID=31234 RepID=E3NU19_CAERE|nr:hypothetical protein CRE_22735 [Caenorhabditis remanei]
MEQFDPNFRIKLAQRVPSLQSVDQLTPLSLEYLRLDDNITVVNDTKYALKVFRKYPANCPIPRHHVIENRDGGCNYDIDQLGFRDLEKQKNPGNIILEGGRVDDLQHQNSANGKKELERLLAYHEGILASCKITVSSRPKVIEPSIPLEPMVDGNDYEDDDDDEDEELSETEEDNYDLFYLDDVVPKPTYWEEINRIEAALLPFHYDGRLPFEPFIQLIIESDSAKSIECYKYTKLDNAISLLRKKMFGGRKLITVGCLEIGMNSEILRVPPNLKFKVNELRIMGSLGLTLEELEPIIDPSSYPLEILEAGIDEHQSKVTKTVAKTFVINNDRFISPDVVRNLNHPNVHFKLDRLKGLQFPGLILSWIEMNKSVGTRVSFSICLEDKAAKIVEVVGKRARNAMMANDKSCVTIPMTDSSETKVYYEDLEIGRILIIEVAQVNN